MPDTVATRDNSTLLKILFGVVSAGFTVLLLVLNGILARIDKIDARLQTLETAYAVTNNTSLENRERIIKLETDLQNHLSNYNQDAHDLIKMFAKKPEEIRVKRSMVKP